MKSAIISFSELGNRMDAGFHILRTEHKDRAEELAGKYDFDEAKIEAVRILKELPPELRKSIDPLVRTGGRRAPDLHDQTRAVEEYPHIALAIFEGVCKDAVAHYQEQVQKAQASISLFETFSGTSK